MTPTPTKTQLQEPDQGDEQGVRVEVDVRVTRRAIRATPRTVAAFLPLRFKVTNATQRRVFVRIGGLDALKLGAGLSASQESDGEKPGRLRISAGGGRAISVRVKHGG